LRTQKARLLQFDLHRQRKAMELDRSHVQTLASLVGLSIPESDLEPIAIRLGELLTAMETIEHELGAEMDCVDPIPPVFPRPDW
jgi:hypothetical protein